MELAERVAERMELMSADEDEDEGDDGDGVEQEEREGRKKRWVERRNADFKL